MTLALVGATLLSSPDDLPVADATVVLENGTIVAAGPRETTPVARTAHELDCTGLYAAAGFWNCHVHFFERKWAQAETIPRTELQRQLAEYAQYGFTTVVDCSSSWENTSRLRERIESGELRGPRILSTGEGIVPPGALPSDAILAALGMMPTPLPVAADATQAQTAAKALIRKGVDAVKMFASGSSPSSPRFSADAFAAVAGVAHAAGKRLFVHPNTAGDVMEALEAGADLIAHTTPRSAWSARTLDLVRRRRPALTPTLALWKNLLRHDRAFAMDTAVDAAVAQLRAWRDAGGAVLFGTDVGAVEVDPAPEYALMQRAGLSFCDVLAALTTTPADFFGEAARRGRIAPGFIADIVVFGAGPQPEAGAPAGVRYTLRAGRLL